jgi:hypothetical protein
VVRDVPVVPGRWRDPRPDAGGVVLQVHQGARAVPLQEEGQIIGLIRYESLYVCKYTKTLLQVKKCSCCIGATFHREHRGLNMT